MKKAAITFVMMIVFAGTAMVSSASESQSYEKVWDSGVIISNPAFDVAVGDTDGDGNPDIIVSDHPTSGGAKIYVFENAGDDSYQLVWNSGTTFTMPLCYMEIGDQDSDGKLEIIAVESSGTRPYNGKIHVFENNGDNTYQEVWNSGVDLSGIEPTGLFLGEDADNDGKCEIIIGTGYQCGDNKIRVYENTGDNTYQEIWNSGTALRDTVLEGAVGDTDGDGKKEIVVGSGDLNPQVHVFECNGDDSYELVSSLGTFNEEIRAIIGDQDGDGKSEIIAGGQDKVVHVFEHTGAIGDNTYTSVWNSGTMNGFIDVIATADQDNDGNGEMIVPCGDGKAYLFENIGDNTYQEVWNSGSVMSGHIYRVATGDQDGDGKLEIIATSRGDKKVYVFENALNIGGAELTLSPESWDFGTVTERSQPQQTFTITNDGTVNLVINDIIPQSCSYISISDISLPATITPGGSPETFIATIDTTGLSGEISETITIHSNDPDEGTVDISVSGKVGLPDLKFYYEDKYSPDGIDIIPEEIVVGEPVTIDVMVTLESGEVTDDFWVKYYLGNPDVDEDGVIDSDAYEIGSDLIGVPLYGGMATSSQIEWTPSDVGTFDIYALIDPEIDTSDLKIGSVVENEEGNNEAHIEVNVIKLLSVPYFHQGKTQWCWLNSIAMILQYYGVKVHSWDYADEHNLGRDRPMIPYFPFCDNIHIDSYIRSKNLIPAIAVLNPNSFGYEGFFDIIIKDSIDDKIPVFLSYDAERHGNKFGHAIVIVGYSIRNGQRYVYIHDPSGDFFSDDDNMFIETPYQNLWNDISGYIDLVEIIIISSEKTIPPSHPVIYFNEDNEWYDCDIGHTEIPEGIESYLYLDKGIGWITSYNSIQGFPKIEPGSQYLRWKNSDIINLNRIVASNPSSELETISIDVTLLEKLGDWWIITFEDTIIDIEIEPRTLIEVDEGTNSQMPLDIQFSKSGTIKLFFEAKANGQVVDEIGPIYINVVTPQDFWITAQCPIDLIIKDPDGLIFSKQQNGISGATYSEIDMNDDGIPDDLIIIPDRKTGDYQITVIPEIDAESTDTYTLKVSAGDTTIVLAEDVTISKIPDQPYLIESTETAIIQIIPAIIDLEPETLNLKSNGEWITAYIELPEGYDIADIDVSTIYLVDAIPIDTSAPATVGDYDSDGISDLMVKFDRTAVVAYLGTGDVTEDETGTDYCEELTLTGKLTDGTPFEGSDTVRIIDKGKGK